MARIPGLGDGRQNMFGANKSPGVSGGQGMSLNVPSAGVAGGGAAPKMGAFGSPQVNNPGYRRPNNMQSGAMYGGNMAGYPGVRQPEQPQRMPYQGMQNPGMMPGGNMYGVGGGQQRQISNPYQSVEMRTQGGMPGYPGAMGGGMWGGANGVTLAGLFGNGPQFPQYGNQGVRSFHPIYGDMMY